MKPLNFSIIGTGIMANIYAKIITQRIDCKLICVAGNTKDRTNIFSDKYKIKGYANSSYDKMFKENPSIDAVIITTPEWVRIEPIESSIKYKKHILLEKPFAKSKHEAEILFNLLKEYPFTFEICHVLRHSPRFYSLKKSLSNNDIGEIRHIYARRNSNNIRVKRVLGKTDLSFWLTPHDVDIMRWITDSEITQVYAVSRNKLQSEDDYLTVNIKFKNNVNAVLQISWCNPPLSATVRDAIFEVWGNNGFIEVEDFNMNIKVFKKNKSVSVYDTYEDFEINGTNYGIFQNLIHHFVNKINNHDISKTSLNDALQTIIACDMISRSINEEKIIILED